MHFSLFKLTSAYQPLPRDVFVFSFPYKDYSFQSSIVETSIEQIIDQTNFNDEWQLETRHADVVYIWTINVFAFVFFFFLLFCYLLLWVASFFNDGSFLKNGDMSSPSLSLKQYSANTNNSFFLPVFSSSPTSLFSFSKKWLFLCSISIVILFFFCYCHGYDPKLYLKVKLYLWCFREFGVSPIIIIIKPRFTLTKSGKYLFESNLWVT